MSELNYKASNIAKAEQALNVNFFTTLEGLGVGVPSFTSLLMILRAGGLNEEEADQLIETEGIQDSLAQAVEALGRAGFLAKLKLTADEKKTIAEAHEKIVEHVTADSQNTGNETKA